MPALSNKDKRKLDSFGLPPNVEPVVRKTWEDKPEADSSAFPTYVTFTVLAIAVLLMSVRHSQFEPFAGFVVVTVWPFALFHVLVSLFMVATATTLSKSVTEKSKEYFLSRNNLGLLKGQYSGKRLFVLSLQSGIAVALILASAPVTAFVWIISIVTLRWAIRVTCDRTARFLLLFEVSLVQVEKDLRPGKSDSPIDGQYVRVS